MIERWEVGIDGNIIFGPDGEVEAPERLAHDIAARLNGPSPAEVAALLRKGEWALTHAMTGEAMCWCCYATKDEVHADCKLDAMIKQCEGA